MPASLHHKWSALLAIDDELKPRTKIEECLDRGCGSCLLRESTATGKTSPTTEEILDDLRSERG